MSDDKLVMGRRKALGLIASSAAVPVLGHAAVPGRPAPAQPRPLPTLRDPDMLNPQYPWALLLTESELATLAVLCDLIMPADEESPAASALGATRYINEHVSAPYEQHQADLIEIRGGLVWLDSESSARFGKPFVALKPGQQTAICDDIRWMPTAKPAYRHAARFFGKVRNMTASAYFTSRQGMAYVGYVGNVPLQQFPPPPAAVMKRLGVALPGASTDQQ